MSDKQIIEKKKLGKGAKVGIGCGSALLFLLVFGAIVGPSTDQAKPQTQGSSPIPAAPASVVVTPTAVIPRLSAKQLHAAYKENEVAADEKFKGKEIDIEGTVESISKDAFDSMYLAISTGEMFQGLHANFEESHKTELAALKPGMKIVVRGTVNGLMLTSVMVKDCQLVK